MKVQEHDIHEERPAGQPSHGTNPCSKGKRLAHENSTGSSILNNAANVHAAKRRRKAVRCTPLGGRGGTLDVGLAKSALKSVWATMQADLKAED